MTRRSDGSALVGREAELSAVERVLRQVLMGTPAVVLVAGEAGIGKTTLVNAVADRALQLGARVGTGLCLDVSTQVPFGPVQEALHGLGAPPVPDPDLTTLVQTVAGTVSTAPTVLLVEDLHWADASTRDLVRTLAHNARGALLLLLTVRTEDAPRGHPTHDLLLDLARARGHQRLDLGPMDEQALHRLATRRLGAEPLPGLVAELRARSEGNPLFAQELLDAQAVGTGTAVPNRLADLFLARVDRLPELAGTVLHAASVLGTRIDEPLVAAATGLSFPAVTQMLKEARDHHVVEVRDGVMEFRHSLVRDSLYEDLLPAERLGLHARIAEALQERSDAAALPDMGLIGNLAFHALHAGDISTALKASVRAGRLSASQGAPGGLEHLSRALELWPQVPDPAGLTGVVHAELLRLAGEATGNTGRKDLARPLLRAAVEEAESGTDRLQLARTYTTYVANAAGRDDPYFERALAGAIESAGPEPTRERAEALVALAITKGLGGRLSECIRAAEEVLDIARSRGELAQEAWGHGIVGLASMQMGFLRKGEAEVWTAADQFAKAGLPYDSLFMRQTLAWDLALSGPSDHAAGVAASAAKDAARLRLPAARHLALEQLAAVQVWRGELDEADATIEEMRSSGLWVHRVGFVVLEMLLSRGDLDDAVAMEPHIVEDDAHEAIPAALPDSYILSLRTELQLALGDVATAAETADSTLASVQRTEVVNQLIVAMLYGHLALRALAARRLPPPSGLPERAAAALQTVESLPLGARVEWQVSWMGAYLLAAQACSAALDGEPRPDLWRRAVDILGETGYALLRLRMQPHLAEDLWAGGDRAGARAVLHDTWHEATRMGAMTVASAAAAVARRHRVALPEQPLSGAQARLTPREREVLDLIEGGATNRQIAEALVISEKTVSVHVSSVLAKLGAAHRGEAAAKARRAIRL